MGRPPALDSKLGPHISAAAPRFPPTYEDFRGACSHSFLPPLYKANCPQLRTVVIGTRLRRSKRLRWFLADPYPNVGDHPIPAARVMGIQRQVLKSSESMKNVEGGGETRPLPAAQGGDCLGCVPE